jgi:hypothetical protein
MERGLARLQSDNLRELSSDDLRARYTQLASLSRAAEAMGASCLAEIDRREQLTPDPGSSPGWWLQESLHLTANTAYALLRTARQLESLPRVARAFRAGQLSSQQVSVICRAVEEAGRTCLEPAWVEQELVAAGQRKDPLELRRHWAQVRYRADQEAGVEAEREQRERRWLRFWQTPWDTYRIEGEMDPESGAVLKTALKALMGRRPAPGDERTPEQRRADAVTELAQRALDAGELPERGGERPHLSLVAELSTLRLEPGSPLASLDWGPLVTGETVRRLAEDALVTPVLMSGSEVLHAGRRKRTLTARQRKALNLRDRRCQAPGCDRSPEQCTPHHLIHWIDGGRSNLPNTRLYCDAHHARLHPENHRFRRPP